MYKTVETQINKMINQFLIQRNENLLSKDYKPVSVSHNSCMIFRVDVGTFLAGLKLTSSNSLTSTIANCDMLYSWSAALKFRNIQRTDKV